MKKSKNSSQQLTLFATSLENNCFITSTKQNNYDQNQEDIVCQIVPFEKL